MVHGWFSCVRPAWRRQKKATPIGTAFSVSIAYGILCLASGTTEIYGHNRSAGFDVLHRSMCLLKLLHIVL